MPISGQIPPGKLQSIPSVWQLLKPNCGSNMEKSLYKQGFLKQAKEEFDGAIDVLLERASDHPRDRAWNAKLRTWLPEFMHSNWRRFAKATDLRIKPMRPRPSTIFEQVETFPAVSIRSSSRKSKRNQRNHPRSSHRDQ